MSDQYFEYFLEKFGQPQQALAVTQEVLNKYQGKLPDQLLQYWEQVGFCGFKEGLFWITNPDDYAEALYAWLEQTDVLDDDIWYVIGRTGFGEFYIWGEKNWLKYKLDITNGQLFETSSSMNDGSIDINTNIQYFFSMRKEKSMNWTDVNSKPLFERSVKKYGALKKDEIFGFEPALILGGEAKLANIRKLDIHVHMAILKEFTDVYTTDLDGLGQILYGAPISSH